MAQNIKKYRTTISRRNVVTCICVIFGPGSSANVQIDNRERQHPLELPRIRRPLVIVMLANRRRTVSPSRPKKKGK